MDKIISGVRQFQREDFPQHEEFFHHLAEKTQKPRALVITCSDSRIDLTRITNTEPGDLFVIRSAGNLVPTNSNSGGGELATIEYSIAVLGIRNIIVCGHSECGAMKAMLDPELTKELPAVRAWFQHAESTRRIVKVKYGHVSGKELVRVAAEENVLVQLNHLSTHPYVAAMLSMGQLRVFGWYYDIGTGRVRQYNQVSGKFEDLGEEALHTEALPVRDPSVTDSFPKFESTPSVQTNQQPSPNNSNQPIV
jgi:carbonic anhydrase